MPILPGKHRHKKRRGKKRSRHRSRKIFPNPFRVRWQGRLIDPIFCGIEHTYIGSVEGPPNVFKYPSNGKYEWRKVCYDQTHLPGPPWRRGGPFKTTVYQFPMFLVHPGVHRAKPGAYGKFYYEGGFVPIPNWNTAASDGISYGIAEDSVNMKPTVNDSLVSPYSRGAGAYSKYKPGNPTADLGQFLWELSDIPRMLSTTAESFHGIWKSMGGNAADFGPKHVADEWVNTQFGWRPFLNDVRKFVKSYHDINRNLDQIRRDNGRWIRRGGPVASVNETKKLATYGSSCMWPTLVSAYYNSYSSGSYTISVNTTQRVWFRGAFRYWIPESRTWWWDAKTVAKIFGLWPSPSVIWNCIPWTWFYDWQYNMGEILKNTSPGYADNLVSKYAYIMADTRKSIIIDDTLNLYGPVKCSRLEGFIHYKRRDEASPFGFGLSSKDFTARQWSILAAIGMTIL